MQIIDIMINCPARDVADNISAALIEQRIVACSNRYAPVQSAYLWKGRVEQQEEHPLLLKTRAALADAVETQVRALHPYEVPPIIRCAVQGANADYIQWVYDVTVQP